MTLPKTDEIPEPPEIGNRIDRAIKRGLTFAREHINTQQGRSMLDETILSMRKRGLSITEIERNLDGQLTREQIEASVAKQLSHFDELTASEMRALQVARIEDVINMCYDYARGGSDKHVAMLLLAIERLNKIFELETDKTQIEITLVTSQQAALLITLLDTVLSIITSDPLVAKALKKSKVPFDYVEGLTAQALDSAERQLAEAQATTVTLDLDKQVATATPNDTTDTNTNTNNVL